MGLRCRRFDFLTWRWEPRKSKVPLQSNVLRHGCRARTAKQWLCHWTVIPAPRHISHTITSSTSTEVTQHEPGVRRAHLDTTARVYSEALVEFQPAQSGSLHRPLVPFSHPATMRGPRLEKGKCQTGVQPTLYAEDK